MTDLPRTSTTDDGVLVATETVPGVRSVVAGAFVSVGSRDETEQEHGCAHYLEHTLFKGTRRRSAQELVEPLDAVGGDLNAYTTQEHTCVHARVLGDDVPLALDLVGDMLSGATNTPADVDAERGVVLSEIDEHLDTPDDVAHSALVEQVVGDAPLGREILGTAEGIAALPRDVVHGFYERWYRPAATVVTAAGDVDHDALVGLVERHLGDLGRPGGSAPVRATPAAPLAATASATERDVEQSQIAIGGRAPALSDPDRAALAVADTVLGGGMSSRLFRTIREEHGLAYTVYSWSTAWTDAGMWGVHAGVHADDHDRALELLRAELDGFATSVTEEEVDRARGNLLAGIVLGTETPSARMHRLGRWWAAGLEPPPLEAVERRIAAVTLDDVRDLAERLYGGVRHLAVVGPVTEADVSAVA